MWKMKSDVLDSDLKEMRIAAKKLAIHVYLLLGSGHGFVTTFIAFLVCAAAIYLLILDRANWKKNISTSLLIPYIFFSLPSVIFYFLRGEFGMWVAFIGVVLRLFFPRHFPDWLELPGSLVLLLVVSPGLIAETIRNSMIGVNICLFIASYLLQENIRSSGGFRKSFTQSKANTIAIILLMVYPIWRLVLCLL